MKRLQRPRESPHIRLYSRYEPRGRRRHGNGAAESGHASRPSGRAVLCLALARATQHDARRPGPGDRARLAGLCGRAPYLAGQPGGLSLGMLGLAQFLPMFALTLFAGHATDIYDRRKTMMAGLGVQLCTSALFGAMAYGGLTLLWPIYGVAALFGCARAFYTPASAGLAPTLVERRLIPRDRRQFGGQSDGDHRRPRGWRAPGGLFARRRFRRVGRAVRCRAPLAHGFRVTAASAASDRLALGAHRRRLELCVDHQDRPRRDQPRSVRGSLGRRHGPLAGLCARHPACRPGRLRNPPRRPVGRRDRAWLRIGRTAAEVGCRAENVRSRSASMGLPPWCSPCRARWS